MAAAAGSAWVSGAAGAPRGGGAAAYPDPPAASITSSPSSTSSSSLRSRGMSKVKKPSINVAATGKAREVDYLVVVNEEEVEEEGETLPRMSTLLLTCSVLFATYWVTVAPSIAGGDSGEIVAESCHLGTAHPPGYPLITMLNHIVIKALPWGTPAWRANLFSAVCNVGAAAFIFWSVDLWGEARRRRSLLLTQRLDDYQMTTTLASAATAAALFAWSPLTWQYAATAEVFGLNNLLMSALVYLTIRFAATPEPLPRERVACLGAFVCGLGLTNQHTSVLFEAPLILYVSWSLRQQLMDHPKRLLSNLGLSFLLGLSPYIYLPLAAILRPQAGSWGKVTTLSGLIHHIRRGDYGTFQLYSGTAQKEPFDHKLYIYATDLTVRQGLYIVPALAVIGLIMSIMWANFLLPLKTEDEVIIASTKAQMQKAMQDVPGGPFNLPTAADEVDGEGEGGEEQRSRSQSSLVAWAVLFAFITYMVVFHMLSNLPLIELFYGVVARFWMQPNIIVFIWAGVGMDWCLDCLVSAFCSPVKQGTRRHRLLQSFFLLSACLVCGLLALWQCKENFEASDFSTATYFSRYARALLEPLPSGSILLVSYDMQWTSLRYLQVCEGLRSDVTVLNLSMMTFAWWASKRHLYEHVHFPGTHYTREGTRDSVNGAFTTRSFLDSNMDRCPGIFLAGKLSWEDEGYRKAYTTLPVGLTVRFFRHEDVWNMKHWYKRSHSAWKTIQKVLPISNLPPLQRYTKETWEYTIVRDFYDHLAESSAHLLDEAVKAKDLHNDNGASANPVILKYLIEAAWWLEVTVQHDQEHKAHVMKNLGLVYLHLVRIQTPGSHLHPFDLPRLGFSDVFEGVAKNVTKWFDREQGVEWRTWATTRFLTCWANFITHPDAKYEPDYQKVKQIYETVTKNKTSY